MRLPRKHRERRLRNRRKNAEQHAEEDHKQALLQLWQRAADELARGQNALVQPDQEKRLPDDHAEKAQHQLTVIGRIFQGGNENADDYDDGGERQRGE